jgi:hypothetical protein
MGATQEDFESTMRRTVQVIGQRPPDVRFRGQSGRALLHCICPLMTQSGHRFSLCTPFRPVRLARYDALFLKPRGSNEAARVHQSIW